MLASVIVRTAVIVLYPTPLSDGKFFWDVIRADGTNRRGGSADSLEEGLRLAKEELDGE